MDLRLADKQPFVNGGERPSLDLAEVGRVAYLESNRLPEGIEPGLEETRFYDPVGVRGVGEGGTLGPAAALAGAVGNALGVAVDRLPITPNSLWELMHQEPAE